MKKDSGIAIAQLSIYVICMLIVAMTIASITTFFYKNVDVSSINEDTTSQFTEFSSFFSKEINKENNIVLDCKNEDGISYIVFSDGNQYTYMKENKAIYKNQVKICEKVDSCDFSYEFIDGEYFVTVKYEDKLINLNNGNGITYTLKHS